MITDTAKLACAKRELRMRQGVYPGWVKNGRMTQDAADHEISCMTAIVEDYTALARQEKPPEPDLFSKQ